MSRNAFTMYPKGGGSSGIVAVAVGRWIGVGIIAVDVGWLLVGAFGDGVDVPMCWCYR